MYCHIHYYYLLQIGQLVYNLGVKVERTSKKHKLNVVRGKVLVQYALSDSTRATYVDT